VRHTFQDPRRAGTQFVYLLMDSELEMFPATFFRSQLRQWCEGVFVGISRLRVVLCDRKGATDDRNDGTTSMETSARLVKQDLCLVNGEHFGGARKRDRKSLALYPASTGGHL
jgi:hypothetical protein